ncbi:uncharacterized protein JCM6883_000224 [Sporobolomyces salmoneus]|uniref:uncharacterized protein n=1 Tax=Sporobolomyces salmoneus TaxID=183962 RepID=UPI00316C358B
MNGSPYRTPKELDTTDRDEREGFPLTPRSSTDSLSRNNNTEPPHARSKLIRLDSGDSYDDDEEEGGSSQRPRLTLYDASWSEDPTAGEDNDLDRDSIDRRRERRRRNRRIYGGGRHSHADGAEDGEQDDEDDGGGGNQDMTVGEVAGLITAGTLSPLPLLVPYACFNLTPALFVPLLALSGLLAWASAVALGIQGRYVGARSYPGLASAVFPHRFKLHLVGEFLASSFVLGGSIVRTTLGVVAASEVVVDLVVPERRRRDWERTVAVGLISLIWLVVPLILPPLLRLLGLYDPSNSQNPVHHHYSRLAAQSSSSVQHLPLPLPSAHSPNLHSSNTRRKPHWTALLLLPAYSLTFVSWPLALLILGVRLKRLNHDQFQLPSPSLPSLPSSDPTTLLPLTSLSSIPFFSPTDPSSGLSLWPSILLTLAALSSTSHESFYYITSLIRPDSTTRNRLLGGIGASMSRRGSAFIEFDDATNGVGDGDVNEGGQAGAEGVNGPGGGGKAKVGKRNNFPVAMGIGIFISFLIQLGWALVGTLGFAPLTQEGEGGEEEQVYIGPSGNLLSDPRLPRGDWWLGIVRVLVLVGILGQLEGHARVGIKRIRRGVKYFFPSTAASSSTTHEHSPGSSPTSPTGGLPPTQTETRAQRLLSPLSRSLIFFIVSVLSLTIVSLPAPHRERFPEDGKGKREVGGHGIGLVYLAEWAGVGLSGLGCCLIPALTYLVLFHLLPPRSILTTSSTTDPLLLAKERQIQRRLGGRRLWTDVAVFGVLGPVGVVVVIRGIWALV